ncbi:MAG: 3-oxoacyl-ACP reductase FabG [Blastocatellia bacterium]|nr:3-oxoacyl-ACP reductase FabG [Blastocatellia bacterium]MBL8197057.1 3-oxoacyl-ACP reductase FabG [Blastocatellia bacterium]MBN8724764.1 3-oxoacyl-ACP reductase FabG [Acidobacteriota bacterium]
MQEQTNLALLNKVAVVTGSSRGIGRAIAIRLGQMGAKVVINYCSNEEEANKALEEVKNTAASSVQIIKADVSKPTEAKNLIDTVLSEHQKVDILINNAAIQRATLVHKMKDADWEEVMALNLSSVFYLCRAVLPKMIESRSGEIVNIGSASGFMAHKGAASYVASKYGLIGLTKVLALETADYGIRVNGVAPGITDTDMIKGLTDAAKERLLSGIPMKRMAKAEEIAEMVAFILTSATYSTGNFFHASGGLIM